MLVMIMIMITDLSLNFMATNSKSRSNKLWKKKDHGSDWHSRYEIRSEVKVVLEYDRLISLGVLLKHPLESELDVGVDSAHRC